MKNSAKKFAAVALILSSAGAAQAATAAAHPSKPAPRPAVERVASGKIERVNAAHHNLTLAHRTYRYSPSLALATVKPGDSVKVFYRQTHGRRMISKIVPATA